MVFACRLERKFKVLRTPVEDVYATFWVRRDVLCGALQRKCTAFQANSDGVEFFQLGLDDAVRDGSDHLHYS